MNRTEDAANCYQCGKCTAGCPQAGRMDLAPNRVLRMVQMGLEERAARSEAIWRCVSCLACSTRCPKEVDCAGVMDRLRQRAAAEKLTAPAAERTELFMEEFLRNVRRNGRLKELELIAAFKTRGFLADASVPFLFKDAMLAPELVRRKKLHLGGGGVADKGVVGRIFARCGR